MQVSGVSQLHGAQSLSGPHASSGAYSSSSASSTTATPTDELQLSSAGQAAASAMNDVPDIRADKVAALRAQIQAGTYETSDRLEGAVSRLLDEIG